MKRDKSKANWKTAAELMTELEGNPEYVARMKSLQAERAKAVAQSLLNAKPLLLDLAAAGFQVDSVSDLYNQRMSYKEAIPILLSWHPRIADPLVKTCVTRALTTKWAKPVAALPLIQEFSGADENLRWVIANALSVVADDSVFEELVLLVRDQRNGKAREMLAIALGNMKNPQAVNVLIELLNDEEVVGHAAMALGVLKAKDARSSLERLASHPKRWIRNEVQKALKRIDAPPRRNHL